MNASYMMENVIVLSFADRTAFGQTVWLSNTESIKPNVSGPDLPEIRGQFVTQSSTGRLSTYIQTKKENITIKFSNITNSITSAVLHQDFGRDLVFTICLKRPFGKRKSMFLFFSTSTG
jgi:hypothetical protein